MVAGYSEAAGATGARIAASRSITSIRLTFNDGVSGKFSSGQTV
jgi:hypothetical protein